MLRNSIVARTIKSNNHHNKRNTAEDHIEISFFHIEGQLRPWQSVHLQHQPGHLRLWFMMEALAELGVSPSHSRAANISMGQQGKVGLLE